MSTPQRIPNYQLGSPEKVPAWDFVQSYIPGKWTEIGKEGSTYLNLFEHYGAPAGDGLWSPAYWRKHGDFVEFCGLITKFGGAGTWTANEAMLQLPPEVRLPLSTRKWISDAHVVGGGVHGQARIDYISATGTLVMAVLYTNAGVVNNVEYVNLTGLRFPLL